MIPPELLDTPEKRAAWVELFKNYETRRRWAIRKFFRIRTKGQRLVELRLNEAQQRFYGIVEKQERERRPVRIIAVKPRKVGLSTGIQGLFFHTATSRRLQKGLTVAHDLESTQEMFSMNDLFYTEMPAYMRPMKRYGSRDELTFENPDEESRKVKPGLRSQLKIGTAGKVELGRSKDIHLLHMCLSPDTWIVEPNGNPRRMGDMAVGDLVRTHTGTVAAISFISTKQKHALSVKFFGANKPLIATPEHKVWTVDGWRELGSLGVGDFIGTPVHRIEEGFIRWPMRLPDNPRPQGGGTRESGPEWISADYNLGRVLGLYLAEGSIDKQSNSGVASKVIFSVHEREVARTLEWLKPLADCWRSPPTVSYAKDSKTAMVKVCGRSFAEFVRARCGELSSKSLPSEWRTAGAGFARGLVHGYLAGDGHSAKGKYCRGITAPSIRGAITFGMRDVLASLGYGWAAVDYRAGAVRNGRNERAQWTLRLMGSGVDVLCSELGWEFPPRSRAVKGQSHFAVRGGYGWMPIASIEPAGVVPVMDFEIAHGDHSYLIWQGGVSNSELPFWQDAEATELSVLNAVPMLPSTMVFKESTPMGVGNKFHRDYLDAKAGRSAFEPYFMAWWEFKEYSKPLDAAPFAAEEFEDSLDELERAEREAYNLTLEQLNWRRWCIDNQCGRDPNKFLQEYPSNDVDCFLVTGRPVFDPMTLKKRLMACTEPTAVGNLYEEGGLVKIRKNTKGFVRMWKPPLMGHRYIIAADVAEGLEHGDFSTGHVLDWETDENVAEWHGHIDPWSFGSELGMLGKVYNMALIGVEANKDGGTVNTRLRNDAYPHLFYRMELEHRSNARRARLGWQTSSTTKPLLVNALDAALRGEFITYNSELISECMTFVHLKDGTLGAQSGCFDDRVIGGGIAQEIRKRHGLGTIFPSLNAADAEARAARAQAEKVA